MQVERRRRGGLWEGGGDGSPQEALRDDVSGDRAAFLTLFSFVAVAMGTVWKALILVAMVLALVDAVPTVTIQKRNDAPPAVVGEETVESSGSNDGAPNNEVPPVKNPALSNLFDDIFNIPIQVLHAVNRLLTNPVNTIGQSTQGKNN